MLRHAAGCNRFTLKTQFTKKNCMRKLRESYDKMYNSSLAVIRQHQACMHAGIISIFH